MEFSMNNEGFENLKEIENLRERIADLENPPTEIIHKAVTVKAPVKAAPATQDDIAAIMLVIKNQRSVMLQEFEEKFDRIFEKAFNKAFDKALNNGK
jgi:CRISPR/Cas system Type II protein with McrA/HNH and RuvC-like nuclease domain